MGRIVTTNTGIQGVASNLDVNVFQRLAGAVRYAVTGKQPAWFGPSEPMQPVAQQTEGRQFDYMPGYNLTISPRAQELVPFDQMRILAENYDIMRLIMESCKDMLCEMDWSIKPKDPKQKRNRKCTEIQNFLSYPDRQNDWQTWLRALLEDMLVIDAATLYPRRNRGNGLYALELIDGATIKPVIGDDGRTPGIDDPRPAYEQILHGVAASEYKSNELYYMPRNRRTHKVYGYSPVEQMITTVNMAIRRQLYQMQLYTDGNIPDLIMGVPATWQPGQITAFQNNWNARLTGQTAELRGVQFVPDGMKPFNVKDQVLKSEDDEWLARICCYCFGVEATPFIRQQNRSTSETVREQALEEGKAPRMRWIKNRMTFIVNDPFGFNAPDLEFAWEEKDSVSVLEKAQIHQIYVTIGALDLNEVRDDLGLEALTPEELEKRGPLASQNIDGEDGESTPTPDTAPKPSDNPSVKKITKADDVEGDDEDTASADKAAALKKKEQRERRLESLLLALLGLLLRRITADIRALGSLDDPAAINAAIVDATTLSATEAARISVAMTAVLSNASLDSAKKALIDIVHTATPEQLSAIDEATTKQELSRVAQILGKKIIEGQHVEAPGSAWSITKSTAEIVTKAVQDGIQNGLTLNEIVDSIKKNKAFSAERAALISRDQIGIAMNEGIIQGWAQSGVVTGKISILAEGDIHHGEDDILNASVGEVPLMEPFPSGHMAPLYHPNCLCTLQPVFGGIPSESNT